jgi:hypothetical protein
VVYVGQTKQFLGTRMKNHAIAKGNERYSALCAHAIQTLHKADFQNVKVIGRESNFGKRLVLKIIEITKRLPIALNKQIDNLL